VLADAAWPKVFTKDEAPRIAVNVAKRRSYCARLDSTPHNTLSESD
jgi:hypothetical protein